MKEDRPKPVVRRLMKARRIVETVIGHYQNDLIYKRYEQEIYGICLID